MKKNIFVMAALAVLATACVKEQQPTDQAPADVEKTVLAVSVETSKVTVDEANGGVTFQTGDELAVWFQTGTEITGEGEDATETAVGTRVVFTYAGTLEDGSAKFEADAASIPAEFISAKAAYPAGSLNAKGAFSLVTDYNYTPGSVPVYIRSENVVKQENGTLSAQLYHNAAVLKLTLNDIPSYAAGIVVETQRTNGKSFEIKTLFPCNSGNLVIYSPVPHTTFPVKVYLIDAGKEKIAGTEKKFKSNSDKLFASGDMIIMPSLDFDSENLPVRNYVNIKGVKFAKGNLQYVKGDGQSGFQSGWRIAPAQWHHMNYTLTKSTTGNKNTYDGSTYVDIRTTNSADAFEHFNAGGIGANARLLTDFITPSSTTPFDFAGKVYSDAAATQELSGNECFATSGKLYGDLAYWASNGVWRLPKASELKYLHNETHKTSAKYITSDGFVIWGFFFSPIVAEARVQGDNKKEITDKDLEYGIFLPHAGRRAEANENTLIAISKQGSYRSGTYVKTNSDKYYSVYYHSSEGSGYMYDDKKYGGNQNIAGTMSHMTGFCIRPVLVEVE